MTFLGAQTNLGGWGGRGDLSCLAHSSGEVCLKKDLPGFW